MRRIVFGRAALAASLCSGLSLAQTLQTRPPAGAAQAPAATMSQASTESVKAGSVTIPMSVAAGTPIKVALDSEVRVRGAGQVIHGKTVEPVYTFDKLLIPAGTVVTGKVSAIDAVPGKIRMFDATDGNFSPARQIHVQFDELVMGDGKHVALQTVASPAPD